MEEKEGKERKETWAKKNNQKKVAAAVMKDVKDTQKKQNKKWKQGERDTARHREGKEEAKEE